MFVNGRNAQLSVNEKADEPSPFFRPTRWLTIKPGFQAPGLRYDVSRYRVD